jgi:hypothetical protein
MGSKGPDRGRHHSHYREGTGFCRREGTFLLEDTKAGALKKKI